MKKLSKKNPVAKSLRSKHLSNKIIPDKRARLLSLALKREADRS